MNNNIDSTYTPIYIDNESALSLKKIAYSVLPDSNTNADIVVSIYNSPEEKKEQNEISEINNK